MVIDVVVLALLESRWFDVFKQDLFKLKQTEMEYIDQKKTESEKWDMKLSELKMQTIDPEIAISYISKHHYSKTCTRSITVAFGFYYNRHLVGCIVFATPVGSLVTQSMAKALDLNGTNVLELTRLFTDDRLPKNSESYCISKAIKYIKQNFSEVYYLVSYADSMYGHCGYIYQATNWIYTGEVDSKVTFEFRGRRYHARTLFGIYGTSSIPKLYEILGDDLKPVYSKSKFRYVYVLGSTKSEHKLLMDELSYDSLPYPKQENKFYRME